jgi:hypothetical protein
VDLTEEMARFPVHLDGHAGRDDRRARGTHFDVDVWPELGPRANAALRLVSYAFILVFALVFVWYGVKFVQFGWNQSSELAEMPMVYIFVSWPLTGSPGWCSASSAWSPTGTSCVRHADPRSAAAGRAAGERRVRAAR